MVQAKRIELFFETPLFKTWVGRIRNAYNSTPRNVRPSLGWLVGLQGANDLCFHISVNFSSSPFPLSFPFPFSSSSFSSFVPHSKFCQICHVRHKVGLLVHSTPVFLAILGSFLHNYPCLFYHPHPLPHVTSLVSIVAPIHVPKILCERRLAK